MTRQTNDKAKAGAPMRRAMRVCRMLGHYGRRHRRWFAQGAAAGLVVVAARLAMPWPLRIIADGWISPDADPPAFLDFPRPEWLTLPVLMGAAFLGVLVTLGLADFLERLFFARFSIGTVKDIRADAYAIAVASDPRSRRTGSGDLVARLIGDTARLKTGLKGFLVHVVTNTIVFAGVTVVLFFLDTALGAIFAIAGVVTTVVTTSGAARVFRRSLDLRKKEGRLATAIHRGLRRGPDEAKFAKINKSSGDDEASVTRLSGIATWTAYVVFGLAVLAALVVGSRGVEAGRIEPGAMVLFMMYALMMRGPVIRLTRQGTRSGKILGAGARLAQILARAEKEPASTPAPPGMPLAGRLELCGVLAKGTKSHGKRPRVGPIDCTVEAGERVAIVGEPGAGKTTLLELLAGRRKAREGSLVWGGNDLKGINSWDLAHHLAYVPQHGQWSRQRLGDLLGTTGDASGASRPLLHLEAVEQITSRLRRGLDTRISSAELSPGERKLINLARLVRDDAKLWLIDDPTAGIPTETATVIMEHLLSAPADTTVLVTMSHPISIDRFDRVIELHEGAVAFDGAPSAWRHSHDTRDDAAPLDAVSGRFAPQKGGMR